jgi:hypothetical protein
MKLLHAILPACALLLPCVVSAETFEGKVTMKISSPSMKDGSQNIDFSIKEGFMRIDMNSARGSAAVVTDFKNQKMLILMEAQKMYMSRPLPQPGAVPPGAKSAYDPSQHSLEATGTKETILGYECTKYVSKGPEETADIWVTDQLGTFAGLFHGGAPGQHAQAPAAWEEAIKGKGFFPMKVVATGKHGTTTLEVTAINKESLPDSLFAAPEGWRDLSAMMGALMPGGH